MNSRVGAAAGLCCSTLVGLSVLARSAGAPAEVPGATPQEAPCATAVIPGGTARLVELTCALSVSNQSPAACSRFVFRVTIPPSGLAWQMARTLPIPGSVVKHHKNGVDRFIEFGFPVPAFSCVTREVTSHVLLLPVDYCGTRQGARHVAEAHPAAFLSPETLIESDAPEITALARKIFSGKATDIEKATAAYEYPASVIRFQPQPPAGALKALKTHSGDCTEFAALFCALCRAGGVPARMTGVFNMGSKTAMTLSEPNHHAAEACIAGWDWVPVDPNLGGGRFDRGIGFAKTGNSVVLLTRAGAWVWSTWLPPDGAEPGPARPRIDTTVSWKLRVLEEGPALSPQALRRFPACF